MNRTALLRTCTQLLVPASLVALLVFSMMKTFDLGCDNLLCHRSGYLYGVRLILGSLVLAWIGRLYLIKVEQSRNNFQLFSSVAVGLVVLMAYVYVRSLFNQIVVNIPISRLEIFGALLILTGTTWYSQLSSENITEDRKYSQRKIAIELAILFALCIIIADRELPRELMLSSDPDTHVFFGVQITRFGGVPYNQHEWGPEGFNYPAGSGVILFIWKLIAGIDHRDSLSVLPIFFTLLSSLVVAESLLFQVKKNIQRALVLLSVIALTDGGLMFPLYDQYVHMEGSARQMSILLVALMIRFAISRLNDPERIRWKALIFPTLLTFLLMALNPANVVLPGAIIFAIFIHGAICKRPDWKLFFILLGGLLLTGLDPFYHNLIGIAKEARVDTVIYTPKFIIKNLPDIAIQTTDIWMHGTGRLFKDFSVLLTETEKPFFLILILIYITFFTFLLERIPFKFSAATVGGLIAFSISFYLVYGLSNALTNDRRYFLLAPYIFFSMAQYKAMFLVLMATWILKEILETKKNIIWALGSAFILVYSTTVLIRSGQGMYLNPRQSYCGAFDCIHVDDRVLLRKWEHMVKNNEFKTSAGAIPKVLIANLIFQSEIETWIFPVSGGRIYPYMKVLPAAFYYYQGDVDYSTKSYMAHVCNQFDRPWLQSKNIQYIFLPTGRQNACVAGMESLIKTEEIVLQEGNSYLLKLKLTP